jgi:hypothetical protein
MMPPVAPFVKTGYTGAQGGILFEFMPFKQTGVGSNQENIPPASCTHGRIEEPLRCPITSAKLRE